MPDYIFGGKCDMRHSANEKTVDTLPRPEYHGLGRSNPGPPAYETQTAGPKV
jgi:hypothetical protein